MQTGERTYKLHAERCPSRKIELGDFLLRDLKCYDYVTLPLCGVLAVERAGCATAPGFMGQLAMKRGTIG